MMKADSQKLCVILGAGASHDVATEGNLVLGGVSLEGVGVDSDYRPPLANDLFPRPRA